MSNYGALAQTMISMLQLDYPPVAIASVTAVPQGISLFEGSAPSSCSFWRQAEKELFAVQDVDHMNCPIGAHVMGFELTPRAQKEFGQAFEMMCGLDYVSEREGAHIPSLAKKGKFLLYGPLSQFPVAPEVVIVWLLPSQVMLVREATGEADWGSAFPSTVFGRPACAALAVASQGAPAAVSLGCIGMRTFTGIEASYMLTALSGKLLGTMELSLKKIKQANAALEKYYYHQKSAIPFVRKG